MERSIAKYCRKIVGSPVELTETRHGDAQLASRATRSTRTCFTDAKNPPRTSRRAYAAIAHARRRFAAARKQRKHSV
jgi:hypothetical protein